MNIIVVGLSHKTAPVELREKLSCPEDELSEVLYRLRSYREIQEGLILSTCNRIDICSVVTDSDKGYERITEFLVSYHSSVTMETLLSHLYYYSGNDAIRHIFRVASSLDSMVVGEPQILGQLKDAFEAAMTHKATGVILNKVFKKAISVAKRVRTTTRIGENAVSVSSAAVELARKIFGELNDRTVLVLGAGEMAELTARHLIDDGVREILITTRNYEKALKLANRFSGKAIKFDTFSDEIYKADIIICSTGAPHYLIKHIDIQRAIQNRKNQPIFLIDISVPRNIDPEVNNIDNVYLYNIDDLKMVVDANRKEREGEVVKAEEIIADEIVTISRWFKTIEVVPTIIALKEKTERIRRAELEKTLAKLDRLEQGEKSLIEELTSSIINKILHAPLVALKQEANSSNGNMYIEAARILFNLDKDLPHHNHKKDNSEIIVPTARNNGK
ncbi:MAG: glutamyl-tRNA reductase [Nitrospirota bacterium]